MKSIETLGGYPLRLQEQRNEFRAITVVVRL